MKINILSDLHLGFASMALPDNDADLLILAGDIARPQQAIDWAAAMDKPVLYVPGNHEYYGSDLTSGIRLLRERSAGTCVDVLHNTEVFASGVRFLGTTLWTDFRLFGKGAVQIAAINEARRAMRDFQRIQVDPVSGRVFSPAHAAALFRQQSSWLVRTLARPFDGPTAVITHHAPSPRSIHPRFDGALLNACFVSLAEHVLDSGAVDLWVHGHTHDSFDYWLGATRVVCNPRGYVRDGVAENPLFDIDFMIDVDALSPPGRAPVQASIHWEEPP